MNLALFDLDNTLIAGDSDHLWGEFLVEQNLVDGEAFKRQNDQFYEDYKKRQLDIRAYLRFALQPLSQFDSEQLKQLHQQFMGKKIEPIMLDKSRALLQKHRDQGDELVIITATNSFITGPIAQAYEVEHLIASEAEIRDGRYTGEPSGTPCYQEGKITRLKDWLQKRAQSYETSYFYSDSANDIPLLDFVDQAFAVDPDPDLLKYAQEQDFPVISLR